MEARQEDFYFSTEDNQISYKNTLEDLFHQQKMSILTSEETQNLHATKSDIRFYGFFALGAVFSILGLFVSHQLNVYENVLLGAVLTILSIAIGYVLAFASFVFVAVMIEKYKNRNKDLYKMHAPVETIQVENYDFVEIVRPEPVEKVVEKEVAAIKEEAYIEIPHAISA